MQEICVTEVSDGLSPPLRVDPHNCVEP